MSIEFETTDRIFFDKFYERYCPMKQSCPSICPIDYCTKIDEEPLIERDQMLVSAFYTWYCPNASPCPKIYPKKYCGVEGINKR